MPMNGSQTPHDGMSIVKMQDTKAKCGIPSPRPSPRKAGERELLRTIMMGSKLVSRSRVAAVLPIDFRRLRDLAMMFLRQVVFMFAETCANGLIY